jgi:sulfur-carrier protein adenylyltransferase/sulfurtransferase
MEKQSDLSKEEVLRYDRHLRLQGFGADKQLKLKHAKVLIVGAGGLGCPIALYLAASGVGKIAIADDDKIEISNLQRQVAFSVNEIGQLKAKALAYRISQLNPLIEVVDLPIRIDVENVEKTIAGFDLVIDGTDNFAARFLIADACYLAKISYLHASVYEYEGQISLFVPDTTACFRCLFRKSPSSSALPPCAEAGVLGVTTGVIGSIAATEAIKYLTGLGHSIAGKILIYDILNEQLKKFDIERDINCPLCGKNASISNLSKPAEKQTEYANCVKRLEANEQIISVARATELLNEKAKRKPFLLDVREEHEYLQGHLVDANLWPLSDLQSLPVEDVRAKFKAKLKNGVKEGYLDISSIILCYCQRGVRSLKAVSILRNAGIDNVYSLEGGIEAWNALSS